MSSLGYEPHSGRIGMARRHGARCATPRDPRAHLSVVLICCCFVANTKETLISYIYTYIYACIYICIHIMPLSLHGSLLDGVESHIDLSVFEHHSTRADDSQRRCRARRWPTCRSSLAAGAPSSRLPHSRLSFISALVVHALSSGDMFIACRELVHETEWSSGASAGAPCDTHEICHGVWHVAFMHRLP